MTTFKIEDEFHDEYLGHFLTLADAQERLEQVVIVPWGAEPNIPPCGNMECLRDWRIVEHGEGGADMRVLAKVRVSASGVEWILNA